MNASENALQHQMSALEKSGEVLFRLRDYTPIPIVLVAILWAQPTVPSLLAGFIVAAFGELTRAYGVAFIGSISRTRSYSNGELVKTGPFSLLRNPLYFGNLVLSLGLGIMSGLWWLPVVVLVIFYAQYIPIVAWEEMKLRAIFGAKYETYCAEVPNRWYPSIPRLLNGQWRAEPVNWAPAWKSEKRTLTSFFAYVIVMSVLFALNNAQGNTLLPLFEQLGNLVP